MWWAWLAGVGGGVLLLLAVCLCCRPRALPRECEVLVIGSGAAGLAAAVASRDRDVVVLEAARSVGGTTARSGGALWIPDNDWKRERGGAETRGQFMEYARARNGRPLTALETRRAEAFFHGAREAAAELVAAGVRLRPSKVSALARDANARYGQGRGPGRGRRTAEHALRLRHRAESLGARENPLRAAGIRGRVHPDRDPRDLARLALAVPAEPAAQRRLQQREGGRPSHRAPQGRATQVPALQDHHVRAGGGLGARGHEVDGDPRGWAECRRLAGRRGDGRGGGPRGSRETGGAVRRGSRVLLRADGSR